MSLRFVAVCLMLASVSFAGCGSDENESKGSGGTGAKDGGGTGGTGAKDGGGTGGSGATDGGGATGGGGTGGSAEAGACKTCAEMVTTKELDLTKACASSATLLNAFVACTCQPTVCGGAGKGCEAECAGTADAGVSQACVTCDTQAGTGACATEFGACMADTGGDK